MAIKLDLSSAVSFLDKTELHANWQHASKAFLDLQKGTGKGSEWRGWRTILAEPNDALLEEIDTLAAEIRAETDVFIVCGIGGSYLGAKALIDALCPVFESNGPKILYAGHHMGGRYLKELLAYISKPNADGTPCRVTLNVISKSGTTIETALAFRVLRNWMHEHYGDDAKGRILCTTSSSGGALNRIISESGYRKFILPDDIGGRFSVLTPVGLLPCAVAGIDIKTLFYAAVHAFNDYEKDPTPVLDYASCRYSLYKKGYAIDVIASFDPELKSLGGWMQQLMGESEGKNHQGMYPAVHGYSTDLHSLGQMVQDGKRNLAETFIVTENSTVTMKLPSTADDFDGLNYLAGRTFHDVNNKAYLGTKKAHHNGGVPVMSVSIHKADAANLGALIYFFEAAVAVYVYCLGDNPFDQPGVEAYKKAMFQLLGKP